MAKFCIICGDPIMGRARKYCAKCKKSEHLEQMAKYYRDHQNRWMMNGLYFKNRRGLQLVGTGSLSGNANTDDWEKEWEQVQQELRSLQLRNRKEKWNF